MNSPVMFVAAFPDAPYNTVGPLFGCLSTSSFNVLPSAAQQPLA